MMFSFTIEVKCEFIQQTSVIGISLDITEYLFFSFSFLFCVYYTGNIVYNNPCCCYDSLVPIEMFIVRGELYIVKSGFCIRDMRCVTVYTLIKQKSIFLKPTSILCWTSAPLAKNVYYQHLKVLDL